MIRTFVKPLPALVAVLLAILLAVKFLDRGWLWPVVFLAIVGAGVLVLYVGGRLAFGRWPYAAGFAMETGAGLLILGAGVAGAVLLWLAIKKAPGEHASTREKEVWTALSAALTAYLGSVIIKPEGELWNPVKNAIKAVFGQRFLNPTTTLQKDARDAIQSDNYGAQHASHAGETVDGWGWDARRTRTRHIQDAL
jgi:hypothetical protein